MASTPSRHRRCSVASASESLGRVGHVGAAMANGWSTSGWPMSLIKDGERGEGGGGDGHVEGVSGSRTVAVGWAAREEGGGEREERISERELIEGGRGVDRSVGWLLAGGRAGGRATGARATACRARATRFLSRRRWGQHVLPEKEEVGLCAQECGTADGRGYPPGLAAQAGQPDQDVEEAVDGSQPGLPPVLQVGYVQRAETPYPCMYIPSLVGGTVSFPSTLP